jgi:hypothetical protein
MHKIHYTWDVGVYHRNNRYLLFLWGVCVWIMEGAGVSQSTITWQRDKNLLWTRKKNNILAWSIYVPNLIKRMMAAFWDIHMLLIHIAYRANCFHFIFSRNGPNLQIVHTVLVPWNLDENISEKLKKWMDQNWHNAYLYH